MSNENNVVNNGDRPIDILIGKLMNDHVTITYQLMTAIATRLLISQETGEIKTVQDFINETQESEGETDDETTEMPDVR